MIRYDKINIFNSNKELEIEFNPKNDEIDKGLLNEIKEFGNINVKNSDTKLEGKKPTREKEKKENEEL